MPVRVRLFVVLFAAALLAGLAPAVQARAQSQPLSEPAQFLTGYLLDRAAPPAGLDVDQAITELTNEELAAEEPDRAAGIRQHQRITGISQTARRLLPTFLIVDFNVSLYRDADGAWASVQEFNPSSTINPRLTTEDLPGVGERAQLKRSPIVSGGQTIDSGWLIFQRGRVGVEIVFVTGTAGISTADLLSLAQVVDANIQAAPPGPLTGAEQALSDPPTPAVLVRGAVRILLSAYVEELEVGALYREAWDGAARALIDAGAIDVPASPRYPSSEVAATALHMEQFPLLEQLAAGRLSEAQLASAALQELVDRRDDCHTYLLSPQQFAREQAEDRGDDVVALGISFAPTPPLRVTSVLPGSPAAAAGFRRGQEVIAINGVPTEGRGVGAARAAIDTREGAQNTFVVRNPSGRVETLTVAPGRFRVPPLETEILPGNIGVLRLYSFQASTEQAELIRAALERFEASGVVAWVMDLRGNGGGSGNTMLQITNLFVSRGVLFGLTSRDEDPDFIEAAGRALPFQRPLAFLVDGASASASEILPGSLQVRGRAIVVGEQTAGCIGSTRRHGLLDGSVLSATTTEIVIGPNGLHLHRIGITPDIEAELTLDDIEAGRDPQLDAAVNALLAMIGQAPVQTPEPVLSGSR